MLARFKKASIFFPARHEPTTLVIDFLASPKDQAEKSLRVMEEIFLVIFHVLD
jgi:hypothetical protein